MLLPFGAGAADHLTAGHLAKSTKFYLLQYTYTVLAREFLLANKTEFHLKLGAYEDPLFIAFPPNSLGPSGVRDLVQFFKS
jgi:aspartyl-tRNA synthetase